MFNSGRRKVGRRKGGEAPQTSEQILPTNWHTLYGPVYDTELYHKIKPFVVKVLDAADARLREKGYSMRDCGPCSLPAAAENGNGFVGNRSAFSTPGGLEAVLFAGGRQISEQRATLVVAIHKTAGNRRQSAIYTAEVPYVGNHQITAEEAEQAFAKLLTNAVNSSGLAIKKYR